MYVHTFQNGSRGFIHKKIKTGKGKDGNKDGKAGNEVNKGGNKKVHYLEPYYNLSPQNYFYIYFF